MWHELGSLATTEVGWERQGHRNRKTNEKPNWLDYGKPAGNPVAFHEVSPRHISADNNTCLRSHCFPFHSKFCSFSVYWAPGRRCSVLISHPASALFFCNSLWLRTLWQYAHHWGGLFPLEAFSMSKRQSTQSVAAHETSKQIPADSGVSASDSLAALWPKKRMKSVWFLECVGDHLILRIPEKGATPPPAKNHDSLILTDSWKFPRIKHPVAPQRQMGNKMYLTLHW